MGILKYSDKIYYEGEWEYDVQQGYGTLNQIGGDLKFGLWQNGELKEPQEDQTKKPILNLDFLPQLKEGDNDPDSIFATPIDVIPEYINEKARQVTQDLK